MANFITGWLVPESNQEAMIKEIQEKEQLLKLLSTDPNKPVNFDCRDILAKYGSPIYSGDKEDDSSSN